MSLSRTTLIRGGSALGIVILGLLVVSLAQANHWFARAHVAVATPTTQPTVRPTQAATATVVPTPSATPNATATTQAYLQAIVPGPLNGEPVRRSVALRRPMAVIVENYAPDARPQTGLTDASVVFETDAEYGVTRFLAIYLEHLPATVGPVRSARVYFDHWANGWHAIFVHAGGNDDALTELFALPGLYDVNEVKWEVNLQPTGIDFFQRMPRQGAAIEHTLYTFPAKVYAYVASQHRAITGQFPAHLTFAPALPPAQRPLTGTIDINFSGPDYAVHYDYDARTNTYLRSMGSGLPPHVDAVTNQQIAPTNVVILNATQNPDPAGVTAGSIYVQSEGTNTALYFTNGRLTRGIWQKTSVNAPLQLLTTAGTPVALTPGQTWIEVLPSSGALTYTLGNQ